jgi:hypothetical protein
VRTISPFAILIGNELVGENLSSLGKLLSSAELGSISYLESIFINLGQLINFSPESTSIIISRVKLILYNSNLFKSVSHHNSTSDEARLTSSFVFFWTSFPPRGHFPQIDLKIRSWRPSIHGPLTSVLSSAKSGWIEMRILWIWVSMLRLVIIN